MTASTNLDGSAAQALIGTVAALQGNVWGRFRPTGTTRQLQPGDPVYADETIVTGKHGAIAITLLDGSRFDMGGNAVMTLDTEIFDPMSLPGVGSTDDVAALQAALLAGADPAELEAAAAGGAGEDEGSSFVILERSAQRTTPEAGYETDPLAAAAGTPAPEDTVLPGPAGETVPLPPDGPEPPQPPENMLPQARADQDFAPAEGNAVAGNVISGAGTRFGEDGRGADDQGDLPAKLTSISYLGTDGQNHVVDVPPEGVIVDTYYGQITARQDGSYAYRAGPLHYEQYPFSGTADFTGQPQGTEYGSSHNIDGVQLFALASDAAGSVGSSFYLSDGLLNTDSEAWTNSLSGLGFNPAHGAGVNSGAGSGHNELIQMQGSTGSQTYQEALALDFGKPVDTATVTLSSFVYSPQGRGAAEQAQWVAYDAGGVEVDRGTILASDFDEIGGDGAHNLTTTIDADSDFRYLVFQPLEIVDSADTPEGGDSQFYIRDVSMTGAAQEPLPATDVIHYTIADSNGDESGASLTVDLVLPYQGDATAAELVGTGAHDYIVGGVDGGQALYGLAGNDVLAGGGGDDRLDGGAGSDTLTGGGGEDTFIVSLLDDGEEVFTDFNVGQDVLHLVDVVSSGADPGLQDVVTNVYSDGGATTLDLISGGSITLMGYDCGSLDELLDSGFNAELFVASNG